MKLTFFYDSQCPLCMSEVNQLDSLDKGKNISFEDIHAPDFIKRYPYIDPTAAYRKLHGQLEDGTIILGLDVTHLAWSLVGKHRWLAILRWPIIRHIADAVYLVFARYRNTFSSLIMGKNCKENCGIKR